MDHAQSEVGDAALKAGRLRTPFDGPNEDSVALHFGVLEPTFVASLAPDGSCSGPAQSLLPDDKVWPSPSPGRPTVPLPLCEFLAYRAALAYRDAAVIERNLGPHEKFHFFDTRGDVGDTQGYGFVRDGTAYIIMRGTESRGDWSVNLDDAMTESLAVPLSWWFRQRLRWRYGGNVLGLVDRVKVVTGRHRGFSIAWASVEDQVLRFVKTLPAGTRIVLSGHSLGGALAQIGAFELVRAGHPVAAVVTFGAPLVGNTAFKAAYDAKLGPCTVLIEAKGDSVPALMRRWYYRLNRELQQFVLNLIQPPEARVQSANFVNVGATWPFVRQPALKEKDVESAIRAIIAERERVARQAEEQAQKKEKDSSDKSEKSDKKTSPADGRDKPSGAESKSPDAAGQTKAGEATSGGPKPGGDSGGNMVLMIIAAIVIVIVLIVIWVFIRGKLSSHAIMNRYALFLSTLSYQRIRSFYADAPHAVEETLKRAEGDLEKYLRFIRGVGGDYVGTAYETVAGLPVRVKPTYDLATLTSVETHII